MRLIKADDVIKSLMDMTYYDDEGHTIHDYKDRLAIVKGFVDSVPTVDAVPVEWIEIDIEQSAFSGYDMHAYEVATMLEEWKEKEGKKNE